VTPILFVAITKLCKYVEHLGLGNTYRKDCHVGEHNIENVKVVSWLIRRLKVGIESETQVYLWSKGLGSLKCAYYNDVKVMKML
jgi:hypothetical protein